MTINKVFISGNLAADCDKRGSEKNPLIMFTVAVNERFTIEGEANERTHWIDCKLFGNYAKALAPSLKKGVRVCIEGALDQNKWEDADGTKHSKLSVKCFNVEILAPKSETEEKPTKKGKKSDKSAAEW